MTTRMLTRCVLVGLAAVIIPFVVKGDPPGTPPLDALIVPPSQYDYKYSGHIVLTRGSEDSTKADCHGASSVGCALRVSAETCFVWIADDDVLTRKGYSYAMVYRHEQAHCNNWKH